MITILGAFITSLIIALIAVPPIVRIAEIKHLYDEPESRKVHQSRTPTLGGVAIFASLMFSLTFWSTQKDIIELQYILSAIIVLFFTGIKDDLFNLVAYKKLLAQLLASAVLVYCAGIRINTFYGLFGIYDLSLMASSLLSIFTIIVIVNSFNLIDGIDGLAGSIGSLASVFFGTWFILTGYPQYAILAFSLLGALIGFLYFNRSPAQIFMGDTGSLIVGLVLSILSIKFIEINRLMTLDAPFKVFAVPVVTLGVLVIPLFDTLRVFIIRVLNGRSPLAPDKNHLHHILLDLGYSHMKATGILLLANIFVIAFVCYFQFLRGEILLGLLLLICLLCHFLMNMLKSKIIAKLSLTNSL